MPRLRDATREERRRRITTAALRCFARDGISGTSMADIVKESGLSSGAIYSHYASKSDLLRQVMSSALADRFALFDPTADSTPSTPEALLDRLLQGPSADRSQTSVLVQLWGEMSKDPELTAVAEENLDHLRRLLAAALLPWAGEGSVGDARIAAVRADEAAQSLITLSFGYAVRLALQPGTDSDALRRTLLSAARSL